MGLVSDSNFVNLISKTNAKMNCLQVMENINYKAVSCDICSTYFDLEYFSLIMKKLIIFAKTIHTMATT